MSTTTTAMTTTATATTTSDVSSTTFVATPTSSLSTGASTGGAPVSTLVDGASTFSDLRFDVAHYVLGALYVLLLALAVFFLVDRVRENRLQNKRLPTSQRIFYVMFIAGSVLRLTWVLLQPLLIERTFSIPQAINDCLNELPALFFFSAYLLLIFLWAEIYHYGTQPTASARAVVPGVAATAAAAEQQKKYKLRLAHLLPLYILVNFLMYLVVVVLLLTHVALDWNEPGYYTRDGAVAMASQNPTRTTMKVLQGVLSAFYLASAALFLTYLFLIWHRLSLTDDSREKNSVLWKLGSIAGFVSLCFVIRSAMALANALEQLELWWTDLVYYGLLEVLPLCLMLFVLCRKKRNAAEQEGTLRITKTTPLLREQAQHYHHYYYRGEVPVNG